MHVRARMDARLGVRERTGGALERRGGARAGAQLGAGMRLDTRAHWRAGACGYGCTVHPRARPSPGMMELT
ncbi:hypothetical protein CRG98_002699 [Punica granatum]|uniref:Uncharacterized protein n=1 Tax=Punica granatum TaxID=22663 RepID=A0A2I0L881_PUNGR|nr:hypothetical protein CRG98_002699 [Punica granatum]